MDKTRRTLIFGVLAVWTITCLGAVVNTDIVPLAAITTPVISVVVGAVLGETYLKQRKNGHGEE
jgi:hypothetical protein